MRRPQLRLVDPEAVAQEHLRLMQLALLLQQRGEIGDASASVDMALAEEVDVQRESGACLLLGQSRLAHLLQRYRELIVAVGHFLRRLAMHGLFHVQRAAERGHHLGASACTHTQARAQKITRAGEAGSVRRLGTEQRRGFRSADLGRTVSL